MGAPVASLRPVAGGDINQAYLATVGESGRRAFVKTRAGAEPGEYEAEAAGLRWLGEGQLPVPEVLAVGGDPPCLVLEWVEPGRLDAGQAEAFGRGLARLHGLGAPAHAWLPGDGGRQRIGSLLIDAVPGERWAQVYAAQRLLPLTRMARDRGSLGAEGALAIEAVADRIDELAGPAEPPARLHGDLWAGNVHAGRDGRAWLIDPSAQGGHRELDLAMLRLFGTPGGDRVFAAYEEESPLAEGHADRVELWQLQPLLVHAVLFGGHYGGAAERAARHYL